MGEAWLSGAVLRGREVPLSQVGCDETRRKIGGVYGISEATMMIRSRSKSSTESIGKDYELLSL